jgi:diacylglycerol O-acyltransferase / wax synthase
MDRLNPLDAAFLDMEDGDPHANLAIASVAIIEGPAPTQEEFVSRVGSVLASIPRARQKVRRVPWDLGLPVWVDDPRFDPGYHFRRTALPTPGDDDALSALVGRIMSNRLDRDHPLWESWVIEGLSGGRWAVLTKIHHCLADGVSGAQLYGMIFNTAAEPATIPAAEPNPGTARLLAGALGELARDAVDQFGLIAGAIRSPRRILRLAKGFAEFAGVVLRPVGTSSLFGPIGAQRRYAIARASLTDIAEIGKVFGVTVNDVVLTAIGLAFRDLLRHRGEQAGAHAVRTVVPVSVRGSDGAGVLDNRVSLLTPLLPVDISDPVRALTTVHSRLAAAKASGEAETGAAITALAAHEPFGPISLAIRLGVRLPQRNLVAVTTNVPGPRQPLFVLGRRMIEALPYVPIALRIRTGVAVMSYCDTMFFGITADHDSSPDVTLLTGTIERAIIDLLTAARSSVDGC